MVNLRDSYFVLALCDGGCYLESTHTRSQVPFTFSPPSIDMLAGQG